MTNALGRAILKRLCLDDSWYVWEDEIQGGEPYSEVTTDLSPITYTFYVEKSDQLYEWQTYIKSITDLAAIFEWLDQEPSVEFEPMVLRDTYRLNRTVTELECGWLDETMSKDTIAYEAHRSNGKKQSDFVLTSFLLPAEVPCFALPKDALTVVNTVVPQW